MNKKKIKYWLKLLDRFGLIMVGMFIGSIVGVVGQQQALLMFNISFGIVLIILILVGILKRKLEKCVKESKGGEK